ncbi:MULTISPECIES: DUF6270 domain-containing protein [Bacillus cereus group]|uniref:Uncharacterized protein n=1 Tax=Bacillus cereus VD048 TaxID=1053226 RepID=J8HK37_BACCE|nr:MULTISPECIES: DUF6270 domain-containing protein [Bacillus cereus group]EJR28058.1 hypothetical protein IIG_04417 [Bacillus cereus VD048]WJE34700.1 DUF6270 domain-containing protein [Bacillus mycoides]
MKKRIGIIGSCVTRDVFDNNINLNIEGDYEIAFYISKSSLISLESQPINDISNIQHHTKFGTKTLQADFRKNWFEHIPLDLDLLIIDFMDERYDCFNIGEGSIITRSDFLLESGLVNKLNIESQLYRVKDETINIWKIACDNFLYKLFKFIKPEKVILHRALYLNSFRNVDGIIKRFDGMYNKYFNLEEIEKHNKLLIGYYNYVTFNHPNLKVIDLLQDNSFVADYEHKWGLAPFHYESRYYQIFKVELEEYLRIHLKSDENC